MGDEARSDKYIIKLQCTVVYKFNNLPKCDWLSIILTHLFWGFASRKYSIYCFRKNMYAIYNSVYSYTIVYIFSHHNPQYG